MNRISNRIYFTETPDNFTLVISNNIPVILKYFFLVMSILVLIITFVLIVPDISFDDFVKKTVKITSGFLSILVSLIWLDKTFKKEIVEVTKTAFSIRLKSLYTNRIKTYLISDIAHFQCAVENAFTKHALHVDGFDYLGAQTAENELQHVIKDGTLEFFYKGARIRFGLNVLSWEGEEIISRIEKFTGNNLRLDDSMEKLLNDLKEDDDQINSDTL